jgi:hypothetical protein
MADADAEEEEAPPRGSEPDLYAVLAGALCKLCSRPVGA